MQTIHLGVSTILGNPFDRMGFNVTSPGLILVTQDEAVFHRRIRRVVVVVVVRGSWEQTGKNQECAIKSDGSSGMECHRNVINKTFRGWIARSPQSRPGFMAVHESLWQPPALHLQLVTFRPGQHNPVAREQVSAWASAESHGVAGARRGLASRTLRTTPSPDSNWVPFHRRRWSLVRAASASFHETEFKGGKAKRSARPGFVHMCAIFLRGDSLILT